MADNKFAALEELMRELNDVEQDTRLKLLVSIMTDAEMRGFADRMCRMFPRDGASTLTTLASEGAKVREILAHTDIGSLPNDWTLEQIAEARLHDMLKLRDQVRDTCVRAETAEKRVERMRGALEMFETEIGLWEMDGPNGPTTIGDIARAALGKDTPDG